MPLRYRDLDTLSNDATLVTLLANTAAAVRTSVMFLAYPQHQQPGAKLQMLWQHPTRNRQLAGLGRNAEQAIKIALQTEQPVTALTRLHGYGQRHTSVTVMVHPVRYPDGKVWGVLVGACDTQADMRRAAEAFGTAAGRAGALLFAQTPPAAPRHADSDHAGQAHYSATDRDWALERLLHDLRTPLAAAEFALDTLVPLLAREDIPASRQHIANARHCVADARRIVRWYSEVNAFGGTSPHMSPASIEESLDRALHLLPGAGHRVNVAIPERSPLVQADELWLTHTFINLLDNALEHGRKDGVVTVTVNITDEFLEVSFRNAGGITLPQERMFMPYAHDRLSDDLTRRGLGLAIVSELVRDMGGGISVDSDGSTWTIFTVRLQIAQP